MDIIKTIEETQKRPGAQGFNVGDTVKVYFKIIEGKTERIQVYEGIVLCKKESFSARRTKVHARHSLFVRFLTV